MQAEEIIDFFRTALKNRKLNHSYALIGNDSVLLLSIAKELSVCLGIENINAHPDIFLLTLKQDDKNIKVDEVRELRRRFSYYAAHKEGWRVGIIDGAEYLSAEAANALLHILEEPGEQTIFFLLARNEELLLPTVRSRCEILYISKEAEKTPFNAKDAEGAQVEDAAKLCSDFVKGSDTDRWKIINQIFKKDREESIDMECIFNVWQKVARDAWKECLYNAGGKDRENYLRRMLNNLIGAQRDLRLNVNKRLSMERLLHGAV